MEFYKRLTPIALDDFDVLPAEITTNACGEGLGDGLLGGETSREVRLGIPEVLAISTLLICEDSGKEALRVAG